MTHEWKDFHPDDGPLLPLGPGQQAQPISGVMPSGEGHFLDHEQSREINPTIYDGGSGINYPFPHPNQETPDNEAFLSQEDPSASPDQFSEEWWEASGAVKTYPENPGAGLHVDGGVFNASELEVPSSNSQETQLREIEQFTIFNDYIHHHLAPGQSPIVIPYISEYFVSSMKFVESFSSEWNNVQGQVENDS